ncbi:MAG: amidohydrolase family protein [Candidatus Sumerlaeia bacterium]
MNSGDKQVFFQPMNEPLTIYSARGLWCPRTGYVDNGAVAVAPEGVVAAAGRSADVSAAVAGRSALRCDCGEGLLIPAFINAHSHLEYSFLRKRMPRGAAFVDWLGAMVLAKSTTPQVTVEQAVPEAVLDMLDGGARAVGEICSSSAAVPALLKSRIRGGRLFAELICPSTQMQPERLRAFETLWTALAGQDRFVAGVSPHAPYTVAPALWGWIRDFRRRRAKAEEELIPQCIHCAETPEEVEMFSRGRGALLERLREWGVLDPDWTPPRCSPVEFLRRMSALDGATLLAHCNCLVDETDPTGRRDLPDIQIIRQAGCSVVVCPGTHQWFDRGGHPLERLCRAGVNVCLGTDSLASNESLSLLREIALARRLAPGLSLAEILSMATINAARALHLDGGWGTLRAGAPEPPLVLRPKAPWSDMDDIDVESAVIVPLEPGLE